MIGKIQFEHGGQTVVAELKDNGRWVCAVPYLQAALNSRWSVRDYSPAHGEFGWKQLQDAADHFEGQVVDRAPVEPAPEGAIH